MAKTGESHLAGSHMNPVSGFRFSVAHSLLFWVLAGSLVLIVAQAGAQSVVINEFMAANSAAYADPQGDYDDWIELYNAGVTAVNVGGMYITDDLTSPTKHRIPTGFPAQTTIPAGGRLILWADNEPLDGPLHVTFKLNADPGEAIGLFAADGVTPINTITFGVQTPNVSFGRFPDGSTVEWRFYSPPSPGGPNTGGYLGRVTAPKFSVNHGIYSAPFIVTISTDTPSAQIYYTLDSSEPTPSSTPYTGPILIAGTKVVRARAYRTNWIPSDIAARTYIFLSSTISQSNAGAIAAGFPVNWIPSVSHPSMTIAGDYEVDPEVVTNPAYSGSLTAALTDLPSLCISMPVDSWFGYNNGLISNSDLADNAGWERACSAEMIYPDGRPGFAINCGISLIGGTSPNIEGNGYKSPKHSLRLLFKDVFGPDRLVVDEPLFPGSRQMSFNTLVLDARMNNAWHYSGGVGGDYQRRIAQYTRDQYANDMQNKLGDPSPHGFYAHVYLNGLFWGMYCIHERPDDAFQADYWGGEPEEYDVLKHNSGTVIAGSNVDYLAMFNLARSGMSDQTNYEMLIGQYLDRDAFINYMLMNFWGGNGDWAHQNWYCGRNRLEPGALFRYYSWDAEKVLQEPGDNVVGLNNSGGPTELHQLLKQNPEYLIRFADRAHKLLRNGGLFTSVPAMAMYDIRVNEIYDPVIMESARWGDRYHDFVDAGSPLYTRDGYWIPELNRLRTLWFPGRANTVLGQLRANGVYPTIEAPVFRINGVYQHGGTIASGANLTMTNPNGSGTIYYTLDGSDPRQPIVGGTSKQLVREQDSKRVLVPTSDIGTNWRTQIGYNDLSWTAGTGIIGFEGSGSGGYQPLLNIDVRTQMYTINGTCYVRIPFTVSASDLTSFTSLTLKVKYDDGFIVYLNGNATPIASRNAPGTPAWNSDATAGHNDALAVVFENIDVTAVLGQLQAGNNFLAIQALNVGPVATSNDFLLSVELVGGTGGSGGGISPTAHNYTTNPPAALTDTTWVRARVLSGGTWSALNDAVYRINVADYNTLRVTEVMYNPAPPSGASYWGNDDFEFVEIKNTGIYTLDLTRVSLADGVYFTFHDSSISDAQLLAPGQHIVVVENENAFRSRYGNSVYVAGQYFGSLDNAGERIRLVGPTSATIVQFEYNDSREWPQAADGSGHSLVPLASALAGQAIGLGDYGGNWRASTYIHGSPGADDPAVPATAPNGVVLNEVAAHTHHTPSPPDSNDWIELYNPTAGDIVLNSCYLSDDIRNLAKWQIPNGTLIRAGRRLSFDEIAHFHNPVGFGLDQNGERAVLSYLPGTGSDRVLDEVRFKGQENGLTLGRYSDGATANGPAVASWRAMLPSRDAANNPPLKQPVISQFMYHPDDGTTASEYIEVSNPTTQSVNLWNAAGCWQIAGGVDYGFPTTVTLPAGGYLLVLPFNPANTAALNAFKAKYGVATLTSQLFGPYTRSLSDRGERLALERPQAPELPGEGVSWVIVDEVFYFHLSPFPTTAGGGGHALHRVSATASGADPTNWVAAPPNLQHTGVVAPFVANKPATSITQNSATLNGEVTATGGQNPTVRIYWGTTDGGTNPAGWQHVENLGVRGVGSFSAPISGLTPATPYYFRAYAWNSAGGTWASATASFTTANPPPTPPVVQHRAATNITQNSARLNGDVLNTGGENPTVRFYWGTTDGGKNTANWQNYRTLGVLGAGSFSTDITGLSASTRYYYQVYAWNSAGSAWAAASGFFDTAPPAVVPPGITTQAPTNITHNSATLNGQVISTGGENPTVRVYWGTVAGGQVPANWEHSQNLGVRGVGPVAAPVSGLTPSTLYFYRFYAENSGGGTWASATAEFTTNNPPITAPTVAILAATEMDCDSARVGGEIQATGGENPSVRIYWGTTDGGQVAGNWQHVELVGQRGIGIFTVILSGLSSETRYYYRVFAQNSGGSAWTNAETFTTQRIPTSTSARHWWHLY